MYASLTGIEPVTFASTGRRSTSELKTLDPGSRENQGLKSVDTRYAGAPLPVVPGRGPLNVNVGMTRFERTTARSQSGCSTKLSYIP